MKSKLFTIILIVSLALSLSVPAFAAANAGSGAYENAKYYLQLNSTCRIVSESYTNFGKYPVYVLYESDGVRFMCDKTLYRLYSDDTYDTMTGKLEQNYTTNGKEWHCTRKWTYPFTISGKEIKDLSDFEIYRSSSSGSGVRLLTDSTIDFSEAIDFFRLPLLETMKVQQGKANLIPLHLASWVRSLMPLGISCLVLLLLVPILSKVLRIFLY